MQNFFADFLQSRNWPRRESRQCWRSGVVWDITIGRAISTRRQKSSRVSALENFHNAQRSGANCRGSVDTLPRQSPASHLASRLLSWMEMLSVFCAGCCTAQIPANHGMLLTSCWIANDRATSIRRSWNWVRRFVLGANPFVANVRSEHSAEPVAGENHEITSRGSAKFWFHFYWRPKATQCSWSEGTPAKD